MRPDTKLTLLTALILTALNACWAPPFEREPLELLESSTRSLSLSGDNFDGSAVRDTIVITSNRSWSATILQGSEWLGVEILESLNLEEYSKEVKVPVTALDNRGEQRTATVLFTCEGLSVPVEVVQMGRVPRLAVLEEGALLDLDPDRGEYTLSVRSNVEWTASIAPDATASLSLSQYEGDGNADITLTLEENLDSENSLDARIIFSAEGLPDYVVELSQRKGVPYLRFPDGICNGEAAAGWFDYTIEFATNVSWSARILSYEGVSEPSLSASSGTRDEKSLTVKFPPAVCFGSVANIKLEFTPEGGESVQFEITQKPAIGVAIVDTLTARTVAADRWPFSSPDKASVPGKKAGNSSDPFYQTYGELTTVSGYTVGLYSPAGLWQTATGGLNAGGAAGSYIASPAVEGRRLSAVYYRCAAASPKRLDFSVREPDLVTIVSGGEQVSLSASRKENTWTLSGTVPGQRYYLYNVSSGNYSLAELIFYYE